MPEHAADGQRNGQAVNPDTTHEDSDANVRAVIWFGVGLVAFGVLAHVVAFGVFGLLDSLAKREDRPLSKLEQQVRGGDPRDVRRMPQPRPQDNEKRDMDELRAAEDARLNNYGWVDREAGKARVPIDVALARMADAK